MSDAAPSPAAGPPGPSAGGPPRPPRGTGSAATAVAATTARPGPVTGLPRPPGPWELAVGTFWRGSAVPLDRARLAAAVVVGLLGGAALVGHRPGLGASVVGIGVLATAVPGLARRRAVGDLLTLALAAALITMVAVRAAEWVVALCVLAAVGAAAAALTGARRPAAVLLAPLGAALGALRALPAVRGSLGDLAGRRRGALLVAVRSLAVTVLLVGVFGALFASADAVFAALLPRVDLGLLPGRVVVGLLVAALAAAAAHLSLAGVPWPAGRTDAARRSARPAEWFVPLVALDAVVLFFVLVQIGALVGGHRFVQRTAGLTYAGYAREGFGQLVAVTVLTLLVVAVAVRWAPRGTPALDRAVRLVLALLCFGTLGVVASAVRRMALYVDAFGLTRLRITVLVAEIALGIVLVLVVAAGVRWRGAWLPRAVVQVAAVSVLALALADPDALIVRHNAAMDPAAGPAAVDLDYLRSLSADAVPAALGVAEPARSAVLDAASVPPSDGWAGWNLGRARAADVLADARP